MSTSFGLRPSFPSRKLVEDCRRSFLKAGFLSEAAREHSVRMSDDSLDLCSQAAVPSRRLRLPFRRFHRIVSFRNGPWLSLVERLNGVQEAAGSNPAGPTTLCSMTYVKTRHKLESE